MLVIRQNLDSVNYSIIILNCQFTVKFLTKLLRFANKYSVRKKKDFFFPIFFILFSFLFYFIFSLLFHIYNNE